MEKVKEEDFLFGEDTIIEIFGKEHIEDLKKNHYERYVRLRNNPCFMPSDIIPTKKQKTQKLKGKFED